jgi:hypothetical protein
MKENGHSEKCAGTRKDNEGSEQSVVRASVVLRARKLLADPAYPGFDEARELAKILLPIL